MAQSFRVRGLGRILLSRRVNERVADETAFAKFATASLKRHARHDWGDMCDDDKAANDDALITGERLFSSYEHATLGKLWIITEADRSATTLLFPDEY